MPYIRWCNVSLRPIRGRSGSTSSSNSIAALSISLFNFAVQAIDGYDIRPCIQISYMNTSLLTQNASVLFRITPCSPLSFDPHLVCENVLFTGTGCTDNCRILLVKTINLHSRVLWLWLTTQICRNERDDIAILLKYVWLKDVIGSRRWWIFSHCLPYNSALKSINYLKTKN